MRKRPVSQYGEDTFGIIIYEAGVLVDADAQEVRIQVIRDADGTVLRDEVNTRESEGVYAMRVTGEETVTMGDHVVRFSFTLNGGVTRTYDQPFTIVSQMPYWDSFDLEQRLMIDNIYHKISDTFDSREGGPYLWELYQTQFNAFETIARLTATDAMTYINYTYQPAFAPPYSIGAGSGGKVFPTQWYGVLEWAGYVQILRHISRSYIEIPDVESVGTARFDRKRYRNEWEREYDAEKETFDKMLRQFKRKFLVGSRRAWLLGGRIPGILVNPARPSYQYVPLRY